MKSFAFLVFLIFTSACTRRDPLCGQWALEYREKLPDSGAPQLTLVRTSSRPALRIDTLVFKPVCFGQDCVIYATHRDGNERMFVVCGNRQPLQLNVPSTQIHEWTMGRAGFETVGDPVLLHRVLYRQYRIFTKRSLVNAASAQPPLIKDWAARSTGRLDPETELRPIDPKSAAAGELLTRAVDKGDVTVALSLIEAGADVDARDEYGQRPIVLAAQSGRIEVVRALLDAGADSGSRDVRGDDILMIAVNRHDVAMVRLLSERRKTVKVDPRSALGVASSLGQRDTTAILEPWARGSG